MPLEIERKYLVRDDTWRAAVATRRLIDQAYLSVEPERTVRIRIAEDRAFITIKGRKLGAVAPEFEFLIPLVDAEAMLSQLPVMGRIRKYRHDVTFAGRVWEVDEFLDENEGLVVAEVELDGEDEAVVLPKWAGLEVTTDPRYFNSSLGMTPFRKWEGHSRIS